MCRGIEAYRSHIFFAASKKSLHGLPFDQSCFFFGTIKNNVNFCTVSGRNHHIQSSQAEMRLIICFGSAGVRRSLTSETIFPARCLEDSTNPTWRSNHQNYGVNQPKYPNYSILPTSCSKKTQTPCLRCKCPQCFISSYHVCCFLSSTKHHFEPRIVPTQSPGHAVKANGQWLAKKRTTCCKRYVNETFG